MTTGRLETLLTQLPRSADDLREELRRLPATREVHARLLELLGDRSVDPFLDSRDFPCSAAILERLGREPSWERELEPSDRAFLRRARERARFDGGSARIVTLVVAVLSLLWNGPWLLLFVGATFFNFAAAALALPFLLATTHALSVLVAAVKLMPPMTRARRAQSRSRLFSLGWWWIVGPLSALIAGLATQQLSAFAVVLAFAVPAMVTAWCCFWLSARLAPDGVLLQRRGRKLS